MVGYSGAFEKMILKLKTKPWPHQLDAINFAIEKPSSMLALSMGYGKSKVVIDILENREHKRVLIVCPKSVIAVWPKQFATHASSQWEMALLDQGDSKRKAARIKAGLLSTRFVAVTNYDAYWREPLAATILGTPWDCIVLDESHRIKAPGGRAAWFAKKLRATQKLALTGTPMPHSPLDVYGQFRFLNPEIFGTNFTLFRSRYAIMGGYEGHQVVGFARLDELHRKFYSIAFRADADLGLPEASHIERTFKLSAPAMRVYRELERELVAEVGSGVVHAGNALTKLLRLQQITSGCVPVETLDDGMNKMVHQKEVDTEKRRLLQDVLEDLDPKEPVVVFCRFRNDLDQIKAVTESLSRSHGELSGRANDLSDWQAGQRTVLGVQIQSGGLGVDFTRARYAIYFSLGFSLGEYEQSLARIHRPGQLRPCFYVHLIAEGTVDVKVYSALEKKKDVVEYVLNDWNHKGQEDCESGYAEAEAIHGAGAPAP